MKIDDYFRSDLWPDIEKILDNGENKYATYLKNALEKANDLRNVLPSLIEYGLSHIKDEEDDLLLGDYFFALSGLRDLSDDIRSFLTDVMVYCEDKHIEFKNLSEIKDYYNKKMLPLL